MRAAISHPRLASVVMLGGILGIIGTFGCFGGRALTDPTGGGPGTGFQSPTPVVTVITLAPSAVKGKPGQTNQVTAIPKDQSGNTMPNATFTWSSSNTKVATVSQTGLIALVHSGTATIAAASGDVTASLGVEVDSTLPPGLSSLTMSPTSAKLTPAESKQFTATAYDASGNAVNGTAVDWASSNSGVASVSGSGLVKAVIVGTTIITATAGGHAASATVQVVAASSGGGTGGGTGGGSGGGNGGGNGGGSGGTGSTHEPAGMEAQINTGVMSGSPAKYGFSVYSPESGGEGGISSSNLNAVPGGTGLRVSYPAGLVAGWSPVRFGHAIAQAGTGWYYHRMKIRFSSNWTNANNPAIKLCEPQTQQHGSGADATENNVIAGWSDPYGNTSVSLAYLQQGPNGHFVDYLSSNRAGILSDGSWHTIEVLLTPESSPGAGNGGYLAWVDGTQVSNNSGIQWLASGNNVGYPYLIFDPVYGGTKSNVPYSMYWDFDQLYVSTR